MMTANQPATKIYSVTIPDGDAGIRQTVVHMQALAQGRGGARSPEVRQAALEAVRGTDRGVHEIDAVFHWVRDNIEFRGEHGETLQEPRITLRFGAGDCDDQSMLTAAMLLALGFETRFRTISLQAEPKDFSHVFVEVMDPLSHQWTPLDTTVNNSFPGWIPGDVARDQTYGVMRQRNISGGLVGLALAGLAAALVF